MFWLSLPTLEDREAIFKVLIARNNRDPKKFDTAKLAAATDGWVGSEIEALIQSTMFNCFADNGKEITTKALLEEARETTPQSKVNQVKYEEMAKSASGKLKFASSLNVETPIEKSFRKIEI